MKKPRAVFVVIGGVWLAVLTAMVICRAEDSAGKNAAAQTGRTHALLVGCTVYDQLPKGPLQLKGPANDVQLLKRLLIDKFRFSPDRIVTLIEGLGADTRPTRKNIEREFKRLADTARAKDRVVVLLSGHGSRQPNDPNDRDDIEPDGMDEVFCPADVARLRADDDGKIQNAIIDDELKIWLQAITDTGASLWFIADSCHSGTVSRHDEVFRGFKAGELLPAGNKGKPATRITTRGTAEEPLAMEMPTMTKGAFVALYASQPHEETYESTFDGARHGLLTHSLCHVLTRCEASLTYRELQQRIYARYRERDGYPPTPLLEGQVIGSLDTRDMLVLGPATSLGVGRPELATRRAPRIMSLKPLGDDRYQLNAGGMHDLTAGSILAVYPAVGTTGERELLGHVRVAQMSPLDAIVEPCEYGGSRPPKNLPADSRCEIVFLDCGLQRLKLGIDPLSEGAATTAEVKRENAPLTTDRLETLRKRLRLLATGKDSLATIVDDLREAEWLVRIRDGKPYLVHRSAEIGQPPGKAPIFGPIPDDADDLFVSWLSIRLARVARAANLVRLAAAEHDTTRGDGQKSLQVDVEILRYADESARDGKSVLWQRVGLQLKAGEIIGFRVTNRSRTPVDVCLLFVDGDYGVSQFFPKPGAAGNRLQPGATFVTRPGRIDATTVGMENLILVAVAAKRLQAELDLSFLEQPNCRRNERTAGETRSPRPRTDSPLEQFLIHNQTSIDKQRGYGRGAIASHSMRLFTWETVPR